MPRGVARLHADDGRQHLSRLPKLLGHVISILRLPADARRRRRYLQYLESYAGVLSLNAVQIAHKSSRRGHLVQIRLSRAIDRGDVRLDRQSPQSARVQDDFLFVSIVGDEEDSWSAIGKSAHLPIHSSDGPGRYREQCARADNSCPETGNLLPLSRCCGDYPAELALPLSRPCRVARRNFTSARSQNRT